METANGLPAMAAQAVRAIVKSAGRRGVHIFGLPREQLVMGWSALVIVGLPLAAFLAMMPFWDHIGEFPWIEKLNSLVAPSIDRLTYDYRSGATPNFHLKRFLVASTSIVEIIFMSNFLVLYARGVRKHALLVWTCYDRSKIFKYFGISGLVFFVIWFVLFFDWRIIEFLAPTRFGVRLIIYCIVAMPLVTLVFGHMTTIVVLGAWRTAIKLKRRTFGRQFARRSARST